MPLGPNEVKTGLAVFDTLPATGGDGVKGSKAGLHVGEGDAGGDVATQAPASGGDKVTNDGKHGDTAVLDLDVAKAVEAVLVSILEQVERIPEAKRGLGTKSLLELHAQARGGGDTASRGEGGNADERSDKSKSAEHFCLVLGNAERRTNKKRKQ